MGFCVINKFIIFVCNYKKKLWLFFRGSVIKSTTLPITLILEQCQLPIVIGNVIVSINFESPITKLPIAACGIHGIDQTRIQMRIHLQVLLIRSIGSLRLVDSFLFGLILGPGHFPLLLTQALAHYVLEQ